MANQILAGAVVSAGAVIAGVDADNPPYVGPPPMTVGWSNAGLSESERVAPAANGMQLYRDSQPYTNEHPNRTLHNLPEYLEGLPFTVESSSVNSVMGTTNSFEEYTFNTSGTLYLILRADWGGYNPSTLELVSASLGDTTPSGVLDPSAWTSVEDSVGYMGGGGNYGTYVFSRSVEAGTHSLNNIYYYAFKADAPEPAPSGPVELVGEPSVSSFSHIPSTRYATPGSPAVTDAATGVDVGRPDSGSSASAMIDVTVEVGTEYEFSFNAITQSGDTMFMGVIPAQGATTPEFGYVGDNALGQYPNTVHNRASVSGSGDSQTIVFTATQTDLQIVMWNSYSENLVNVQFISLKATS